jgi:hypothetical protein
MIEMRDSNGRWLKGTTGNAAGRGMTNRQRISQKLLGDLATVWETHGESVLERLALSDPGKLATIAYGLLPRDVFISVARFCVLIAQSYKARINRSSSLRVLKAKVSVCGCPYSTIAFREFISSSPSARSRPGGGCFAAGVVILGQPRHFSRRPKA